MDIYYGGSNHSGESFNLYLMSFYSLYHVSLQISPFINSVFLIFYHHHMALGLGWWLVPRFNFFNKKDDHKEKLKLNPYLATKE